ncbi:FAD dependent oxidoreductase [Meredithblackwellia eburnea MCA 4105]
MSQEESPSIVIIGAGIIGISSAYYILTHPARPKNTNVVLVENATSGIAPAASSWAGGFIAEGWQDDPSKSLSSLSWNCHVQIARNLGGEANFGFRQCSSTGLRVGGGNQSRSAYRNLPNGKKEVLHNDWLVGEREDLTGTLGMGQIDPRLYCQTVHKHCTDLGLTTIFGEVKYLSPPNTSSSSSSSSSTTTPRTILISPYSSPSTQLSIPVSSLIITAGPWSARVCQQLSLPSIQLTNLPGHSVLIRPPERTELPAECIFAGISGAAVGVHASTSGAARSLSLDELDEGFTKSPEAFTRPNGLVYVAGENTIPATERAVKTTLPHKLPLNADDVQELLDQNLVTRLLNGAGAISPSMNIHNGAKLERAKFCYRPITPDGAPMIGELEPGVFIATGHGPWGISLAPGTGKVVSELVLAPRGTKPRLSADISGLSPHRFPAKAKL